MAKFIINRNKMQANNTFNLDWTPLEIDNEEELTLLSAVCQIIDVVRDSQYDPRIFEVASRPIAYITNLLGLTESQAVVYAIIMEMYYDHQISTCDIGRCLGLPPIKAMVFHKEMEELCKLKYIICYHDEDNIEKQYCVSPEAITSLQQNTPIVCEQMVINDIEDWFAALDNIIVSRCKGNIDFNTLCTRINTIIKENEHLHFVKKFLAKTNDMSLDNKMLFLWICNMIVSDGFESVTADQFKKLHNDMYVYRILRKSLANGTNPLIKNKLLQIATSSDTRIRDCYEIPSSVAEEMFVGIDIDFKSAKQKDILNPKDITPKQMFYNDREQNAIDRLASLLQPERFVEVRKELQNQGFRSGFACLFHGAPGTGKTETVLQLARTTGRNIMQVNISEIKSMWVGESEKNIKAIFSRYRKLVEESEIAPILLFNEADAIIGKRLKNTTHSSDKMENAMQNILLEEIERLDGILIATTNLTCNMDSAFERRFIYKIEFDKPSLEAKCSIWKSMIKELNDNDAHTLASTYNFSGGQIENIARKCVVDKIISDEPISLASLHKHCNAETLDKSIKRRPIGFLASTH